MTKPPTNPSLVIVGRPTIVKSTLFTNLSDFKRLTELVAAETGERIRDTELEDRFLGRLHLNGVEVHIALLKSFHERYRPPPNRPPISTYFLKPNFTNTRCACSGGKFVVPRDETH